LAEKRNGVFGSLAVKDDRFFPLVKAAVVLVWIGLFVAIPTATAQADMGIKPDMEFKFVSENPQQSFSIQSAILYECQQADCSDAQSVPEIGPQQLYCQQEICTINFYDLAPYYRLEVSLADGRTLSSQVFTPRGMRSFYSVTVRESDLLVKNRFSLNPLASSICLSVCGSLWLVGLWALLTLLGLNKR
jgi:hypothetical protein